MLVEKSEDIIGPDSGSKIAEGMTVLASNGQFESFREQRLKHQP
jgi:hypothetical protein